MRFLIPLSLLLSLTIAHANTLQNNNQNPTEPSSEIPDRRDFPVNEALNPCQDFHQYVCSNVESSFKLHPDRSAHVFSGHDSVERLLLQKMNFFKNIENEKNLPPRALQVKNYYSACMNEQQGAAEEKNFIQKQMAELRSLKSTDELFKYDLENMLSGRGSLLNFGNNPSLSNSDIYDLVLVASFMGLPDHDYYNNTELVEDYKKLRISFFQILEPATDTEVLRQRVEKMFDLEKEFIAIYPRIEIRRKRWSEKHDITQEEFVKLYPALTIDKLLLQIPNNTRISIPYPEALSFYNQTIATGSIETLKDIYAYSNLSELMDDAYPLFFKQKFDFQKKYFGGADERSSRQERCTKATQNAFNMELDHLLIDRIFPNFPSEKVQKLADLVRQSILTGLKNNTWLSMDAKKEALLKMATARLQLVKPTTDLEWNFNLVRQYTVDRKILNSEILGKAQGDKAFQELKGPVNKEAWSMGPLTVNASYTRSDNKFMMPIGILQYPFFDREGSLLENLGAVGVVIGHELGHGIDDQGSKYDEKGELRDWMSSADLENFSRRGQKMIEQFDKIGHNGQNTLGENVADLVGITFAYGAAFPNPTLASIVDKQKFFISYARLWCNVIKPGAEEERIKTDPHSLGWARINEQVKHQKGFAEAFSCKPGDPMTLPESERITIW